MALRALFTVQPDQITFMTKCNGDKIDIVHVNLDAENAANLATLINSGDVLEIKIKKHGESE